MHTPASGVVAECEAVRGPTPSWLYVATVMVYVVKLASPWRRYIPLMGITATKMGDVRGGGGGGEMKIWYPSNVSNPDEGSWNT